MQEIRSRRLFGYIQCDLKVPEHLKAYFANFPPIFKNTVVSGNDIGDLIKEYAKNEGIMSQPSRMLMPSFHLKNGTIITPLLLYYLHLGLECTKIHHFVQYTPKKCFSSFVQAAVNARRQGDENSNSSVVAETMKFSADSPMGTRSWIVVDTLWQSIRTMKRLTEQTIINFSTRPNLITDQLYEVELVKSEIEHRQPIIVGFFILQYPISECRSFIINSWKSFAIAKSLESLKRIPPLYN